MKRITQITIVIGALTLLASSPAVKTLEQLVSSAPGAVNFTSNGEHSGKSVIMTLSSPKAKKMKFSVRSGTLFYPENEDEQTLVVPHDKLIVFDPNGKANIELYGFCTERSDRCPSKDAKFSMGTNKNKQLDQLLAFFKENKGIEKSAVQEAIWCVTNNQSIANVYTENQELGNKLRKELASITGQKVPWNTTKREISVNEYGEIETTPVIVVGDVVFNTTKPIVVLSHIENETGEIVWNPDQKFTIPKALKGITLEFKVRVRGWEKGKYFVKYYGDDNTPITTKEFEV